MRTMTIAIAKKPFDGLTASIQDRGGTDLPQSILENSGAQVSLCGSANAVKQQRGAF